MNILILHQNFSWALKAMWCHHAARGNYILPCSMTESRIDHAAAHHKDLGFLITGGKWPESFKSSTEITRDGDTFEAFTPLPIGLRAHCMVALDGDEEGDFFVGGGDKSGQKYTKSAYIYKSNQWVGVEELPTGSRGKKPYLDIHNELCCKLFLAALMCGPVRAGSRIEKIVAAGGWADARLDKVDIYDITSNTWVAGE